MRPRGAPSGARATAPSRPPTRARPDDGFRATRTGLLALQDDCLELADTLDATLRATAGELARLRRWAPLVGWWLVGHARAVEDAEARARHVEALQQAVGRADRAIYAAMKAYNASLDAAEARTSRAQRPLMMVGLASRLAGLIPREALTQLHQAEAEQLRDCRAGQPLPCPEIRGWVVPGANDLQVREHGARLQAHQAATEAAQLLRAARAALPAR